MSTEDLILANEWLMKANRQLAEANSQLERALAEYKAAETDLQARAKNAAGGERTLRELRDGLEAARKRTRALLVAVPAVALGVILWTAFLSSRTAPRAPAEARPASPASPARAASREELARIEGEIARLASKEKEMAAAVSSLQQANDRARQIWAAQEGELQAVLRGMGAPDKGTEDRPPAKWERLY